VADVRCPVLVGRDAELATLAAALEAALGGRGGLVLLTGEPGLGKSRLVREAAAMAEARQTPVVVGRAVPAASSMPYRPLSEALLQALRNRPLPRDADLVPWLPALAAIVPTIGGEARGELSSSFRGEAVVRLLGHLARPAGLVLALEDLHWADPDSAEPGALDHLVSAVQQHASGSHGHDVTREHVLDELTVG